MAQGGARGADGDALIHPQRTEPLSTEDEGGPGVRARARGMLDSAPGVSSRRRETAREWAGHCGHLGPVPTGRFFSFSFSFLFSISSLFSLLFLFQFTFVKYEE
jgi:hypothetical protein